MPVNASPGGRNCRQPARKPIKIASAINHPDAAERPCRVPATRWENAVGETIAQDQHYTPAELANVWHVSPNTIRRIFEPEPGVLTFGAASPSRSPRRRRMTQMRIPARVAMRVHALLSNS